jgi:2-dehydro-3-deoxygluconokinase
MKVAAIGECMIELSRDRDGRLVQGYGGDTLNTAVYLARLGVPVDYITALGDDPYSEQMIQFWQTEGVGSHLVIRLPGGLPGLYAIETDARGERRFYYWRDSAAARQLFELPQSAELVNALVDYDLLYLSGITLSLYRERGREVLMTLLDRAREGGCQVAFDSNYRVRSWSDPDVARQVFTQLLKHTDIALSTFEDEQALFGDADPGEAIERLHRLGIVEVVIKLGAQGSIVSSPAGKAMIPAMTVATPVDTTAAGDSFNAGYLAARLGGALPEEAARHGSRLAAEVICHRGAIIPRQAMPAGLLGPVA